MRALWLHKQLVNIKNRQKLVDANIGRVKIKKNASASSPWLVDTRTSDEILWERETVTNISSLGTKSAHALESVGICTVGEL